MKRVHLIEIGILAVALICGYNFVESLISIIMASLYQFTYNFGDAWAGLFGYFIVVIIYFVAFFVLIKFSTPIAVYIDKQGQAPGVNTEAETINISIQQGNLLFIVLVAMCLITLIAEIPTLLISVYNYFKKEAGGIRFGTAEDLDFKASAIKFTFTIIILFFAKPISAWFSKQSLPEKPLIETPSES